MKALVEDMKNDIEHPGQPTLIVSNNINANGLLFAKQNSIETLHFLCKFERKSKK